MNGRSKQHSTQNTAVGVVYKEFIDDESSRTSSSRRWRSHEEFQTTAEFERHDRRIARYRDRNWGKVFTLSVIKAPKVDFYGRGSKDDYQKNWDLGLGLPERAAGIDEEPRICTEER